MKNIMTILTKMNITFKIIDFKLFIYINPFNDNLKCNIHIITIYSFKNSFKLDFGPNDLSSVGTLEQLNRWLEENINIRIPEKVIDEFSARLLMDKIRGRIIYGPE